MSKDGLVMLKKALIKEIGQKVFFIWEIKNIISNLAKQEDYTKEAIRKHLEDFKIKPKDCGIDPDKYGVHTGILVYLQTDVWEYLKSLESKGVIRLTDRGIDNIEDILEKGYHEVNFRHDRMRSGKVGRNYPDGMFVSPSWDDAVRTIEGG